MSEIKTSKAQLEANKRYRAKNPEKIKHNTYRSQAKSYIKNWANHEELEELKNWIDQKRKGEEIK